MKQFNQKITAIVSAILITLTLVGINTDQAIAKDKGRKGAKVRSGGGAKINPALVTQIGTSDLQNAENVRSQTKSKKKVGAKPFSIDIGTSENLGSLAKESLLKTTRRARK